MNAAEMTIMKDIHLQRIEFLRRDVGAPDLLLVPFDQEYEFKGQLFTANSYIGPIDNLTYNGMKVVFVDPKFCKNITVAASKRALK